ncbi:MAG: hypothetical protein OXI53_09110 [Nitrospira sp.]|nr:hypothetical protein [Nitrospira sp.]MDE0405454.1 hypothetical protein [Nitrospira sp.]MDE0485685.1 hypothetical protein [Nitrospira sp.]
MPRRFDFKSDLRPSTLASLFMVALEWDADDFPEKTVYVYVDSQHARDVANIRDGAEVIARGTIQKIERTSLTIEDATVIPVG